MTDYLFLVPISLALGLVGLAAFLWTLHAEQYDDLEGAAERVLELDDRPIVPSADPGAADPGAADPAADDRR